MRVAVGGQGERLDALEVELTAAGLEMLVGAQGQAHGSGDLPGGHAAAPADRPEGFLEGVGLTERAIGGRHGTSTAQRGLLAAMFLLASPGQAINGCRGDLLTKCEQCRIITDRDRMKRGVGVMDLRQNVAHVPPDHCVERSRMLPKPADIAECW